jgi:xanthine dehydrogenase small subunit
MTGTRGQLLLHVNGEPCTISGADVFLSLADFLRRRLGLAGTKVACGQGGCGACSVLIGRLDGSNEERLIYRTVDACIVSLYQLDLTHVVTVEGVSTGADLDPIQRALVEGHGSQCGFCTPGFVVSLEGLFENRADDAPLSEDELRGALSGNLCRCTGYLQILEAGRQIDPGALRSLGDRYPAKEIISAFLALRHDEVLIEEGPGGAARSVHIPRTLGAALRLRGEYPEALVVAGGTALPAAPPGDSAHALRLLFIGSVRELSTLECQDGALVCGALATWSEIQRGAQEALPALAKLAAQVGGPQLRNLGTLGGNAMGASGSADSLPLLFASDAEFELSGPEGTRRVGVDDFYLPDGSPALGDGELLTRIAIPQLVSNERLLLYRVSRRRELDSATFTAALRLVVEQGCIRSARVAIGGVEPQVRRLPATETFLTGCALGGERGKETMYAAGRLARGELSPRADVRGSARFRAQLAENIFKKAHYDLEGSM